MKRYCIAFMLICITAGLFAQEEPKMAVGLGLEWNMNARKNFAMGWAASFDINFSRSFAAGVNFSASNNFSGFTVLEPAALFRWYFLGRGHSGFFAQAELGAYLFLEDNEITPMFLGGLRGGFRFPLGKFYVEPYGRLGYPFMFGLGMVAGVRF